MIPAKYGAKSVLESLPLPPHVLSDLSELDAATNERKIAENRRQARRSVLGELLFGVPEADIVNAAFTHPGPFGGRFNGPQRGAWYAGVEIETSVAEVAFHKRRFLAEGRIKGRHTFDYIDFLADFSGSFHTLDARERKACLKPEPDSAVLPGLPGAREQAPVQGFKRDRVSECSPALRDLYRVLPPALVFHPRRGKQYQLTLEAGTTNSGFKAVAPGR